jgi:hypothetical protein
MSKKTGDQKQADAAASKDATAGEALAASESRCATEGVPLLGYHNTSENMIASATGTGGLNIGLRGWADFMAATPYPATYSSGQTVGEVNSRQDDVMVGLRLQAVEQRLKHLTHSQPLATALGTEIVNTAYNSMAFVQTRPGAMNLVPGGTLLSSLPARADQRLGVIVLQGLDEPGVLSEPGRIFPYESSHRTNIVSDSEGDAQRQTWYNWAKRYESTYATAPPLGLDIHDLHPRQPPER